MLAAANEQNFNVIGTLRDCIGSERLMADIMHRYHYKRGEKQAGAAMLRELSETLDYAKEQLSKALGISRTTTLWRLEKEQAGGQQ